MVPSSQEERRRYPRLDIRIFSILVLVRPVAGEALDIFPGDISIGGISFQTDVVLHIADQLKLTLGFPANPLPEQVLAQVAWTHLSDKKGEHGRILYDVGIYFLEISKDALKEITGLYIRQSNE